jgi:hypothetical protein
MDTFIVRVYRYPGRKGQEYLGVVEFTDGTPRRRFHSDNELIDIIACAQAKGEVQVQYCRKE